MGRRSVNTTKSGKYMNPTDQARKIARRKELKKNKKQRNEVRMAVLKSKDPRHLLDEMEQVDLMEFNPRQAPSLSERVLKEKRRKLKETFDRVLHMYERENPDLAVELKKAEVEYEKLRAKRQLYYEQVKNAEKVNIDMIPLPDAPGLQASTLNMIPARDIPMPPSGILKRTIGPQMLPLDKLTPPGHPPGPPPSLSDEEEEEENSVDDTSRKNKDETDKKEKEKTKKRRIRFEDDEEEVENEEKDTRSKFKSPAAYKKSKEKEDEEEDDGGLVEGAVVHKPPIVPPIMYRLPPPMIGIIPRPPPRLNPPPIRPGQNLSILTAPPNINKPLNPSAATISAKPKIRSLIGDATRFTPVSLKVRREVRDNRGNIVKSAPVSGSTTTKVPVEDDSRSQVPSTDDAYDSFMKEMQSLL